MDDAKKKEYLKKIIPIMKGFRANGFNDDEIFEAIKTAPFPLWFLLYIANNFDKMME